MPELGRTTPCAECPWLKKSAPGYLGADNPEHFFRASVTRENEMPCHMQIDYDGDPGWLVNQFPYVDYCAGNLIFYKNWLKTPRRMKLCEAVRAVKTSPHVFQDPEEFFAHHAPEADAGIVRRALWALRPGRRGGNNMRVTPDMHTEGMIPLIKLADFLDESGDGLKIDRTGDLIEITSDSTSFSKTTLRFVPSDIWLIMARMGLLAVQAQELYPEEVKAGPDDYLWLRIVKP